MTMPLPSKSNSTKISLDAGDFTDILSSQLSCLQSLLVAEHRKEVEWLRTENHSLRERLLAFERKGSKPSWKDYEYWSDGKVDSSGERTTIDTDGSEASEGDTTTKSSEHSAPRASSTVQTNACEEVQLITKTEMYIHDHEVHQEKISEVEVPAAISDQSDEQVDSPKPPSTPDPCESSKNPRVAPFRRFAPPKRQHSYLLEGESFLKRIVMSQTFELASGGVILASTVVLAMRLQYDGIDIGFNIGAGNFSRPAPDTWPHAESVFEWMDLVFNSIFVSELLIRMAALRLQSLHSGWMWFDTIVVSLGAAETFAGAALPINPSMLRVLRLVRLLRLFKILKTMQSFDSLFLLQKAIAASMCAAVWSFGILIAVQLIVGLFLNQLAHTFLMEEGGSPEGKQAVYRYFGTFSGTMLTMFEITMANWMGPCRVLVDNVSEWFIVFFILYRCFFGFAVLKVISAVFITETNRVLQHDDELTLMRIHREKALFDRKVRSIVAGVSGTSLKWHDVEELAHDPTVVAALTALGIASRDLQKLFWLLDDGSSTVETDLFLSQVNKLSGAAKGSDMLTLLKLTHKVDHGMSQLLEKQCLPQMGSSEEEALIESQCCNLVPFK